MEREKCALNFSKAMKSFFEKGRVRSEEAEFLLELLENGSSRDELESILNLRLNDHKTVHRYLGRASHAIFEQMEETIGFGFALTIGLQLRLMEDHNKKCYAKRLAYPSFLVFTAYTVLFMFLFMIRETIENTRSSLGMKVGISNDLLQTIFVLLSILFFSILSYFLYRIIFKKVQFFEALHQKSPNNAWTILTSIKFSHLFRALYAHGLSTREIIGFLSNLIHQPILTNIANQMQLELGQGGLIDRSIDCLDPFLSRILRLESHPDFAQKLMQYEKIAQKRFEFNVERTAYSMTIFAYISIIFLVLVLYREIMFPLQIIQGMK